MYFGSDHQCRQPLPFLFPAGILFPSDGPKLGINLKKFMVVLGRWYKKNLAKYQTSAADYAGGLGVDRLVLYALVKYGTKLVQKFEIMFRGIC